MFVTIGQKIDFCADIVDTVDDVVGVIGEEGGSSFEGPEIDNGFEVYKGADGGEEGA
jgi:hypothetical protein